MSITKTIAQPLEVIAWYPDCSECDVIGSKGDIYTVNYGVNSCTCKGYTQGHHVCRHIDFILGLRSELFGNPF